MLTSAGKVPRRGRVLLDGRPISDAQSGADVSHGVITVRGQRLYSLVSLPRRPAPIMLTVVLPPSVSAYDFTFG